MAFILYMSPEAKNVPTESQLFWRKMFQTGELTPYDREKPPIKWDAFVNASYEWINDPISFIKNFGEHVKNIDYEFRGEKDIGNAKERLQRTGALLGVFGAFFAFDYLTGPVWETEFNRHFPGTDSRKDPNNKVYAAVRKFVSVLNDKYASDLSNLAVTELTGEKGGFNHQIADKGADTLNTGFAEKFDDKMNAPMIESVLRILFQVPIAGALLEQGAVRLTNFQEKSGLHTNFGKMVYMAVGEYYAVMRQKEAQKPDYIHAWIDKKRPNAPESQRTIIGLLTHK